MATSFVCVAHGVCVRCRAERARFVVCQQGSTVTVTVEAEAGPRRPTAPSAVPCTPPPDDLGLCGNMKRTLLLDHAGNIEDATLVFLSPADFARAVAGPPLPLLPVTERPEPFGRCVEFYDRRGELCRTEWSSRVARRAA